MIFTMTTNRYAKSAAQQAARHIAGGVVSLNRKVEPDIAFVKALGSKLWDADGNEYIDYHAAFAPHILGHNDPDVNAKVREAMESNWSLMGSGTTTWEVRLAELIRKCVPSLERVQITNTGSEATAHAIRLSRAFTGRDDIILPLGGYNGWHNDVARAVAPPLTETGPRVSPGEYKFLPSSAGIPDATARKVHLVNYNDIDSIEYVMQRYPIACVLSEPALQNIGVVPPKDGYLQALRKACDRHGVVLVFDEVKTGFRAALGGFQSRCGVTPDLSVYGKAVANGYPLGVIGGKAQIMDLFAAADPKKRVLIAGTYNAHPFTSAAAIATLEKLMRNDGEVYRQLEAKGATLQAGLEKIFAERGIAAKVSRIASAFCVYFCDHVPVDYHDLAQSHNFDFDKRYRRALIDAGVYYFPIPTKQGSLSAAHSDADIAKTLEITRSIVGSL
jgi:glutamate-1-semialdehyde 2,1-aminomutase